MSTDEWLEKWKEYFLMWYDEGKVEEKVSEAIEFASIWSIAILSFPPLTDTIPWSKYGVANSIASLTFSSTFPSSYHIKKYSFHFSNHSSVLIISPS